LQIRYDHAGDAVLSFKIQHYDDTGVAIHPPVLEVVDERNGCRWVLGHSDAKRLRDYLDMM
jgi:hypothetical protein